MWITCMQLLGLCDSENNKHGGDSYFAHWNTAKQRSDTTLMFAFGNPKRPSLFYSWHKIYEGDQKVLQLGYKKLTYHITHRPTVSFRHILLLHQYILKTFLLSCLCIENIFFLLWLSNHASTVIFSDVSSVNQITRRRYFRFLIRK